MVARHRRDPSRPDVFIYFSRRSGSTWLTELVAAEPGMRFVQDPLIARNVLPEYRALLRGQRFPYFLRPIPEHEALPTLLALPAQLGIEAPPA